MLLMKRRGGEVYTLLYFISISMVFHWSEAKDYNCKPDEVRFRCHKSGRCIPRDWECDNEGDCSDNSDEKHCAPCDDKDKFSCDGHCILKQWLCDGSRDCKDGSDESGELCSNKTCGSDEIMCTKSKRCIPKNWVCDFEMDCDDGSDEDNCSVKSCPSTLFQCKNNKCIDRKWKCDHDNDCDDDSDEVNCTYSLCDTRWAFQCENSRCIQKEAFCDNYYDCADKSDEPAGCTSNMDLKTKCPTDRFDCKDGDCILHGWVCDGDKDCHSGEDEANCTKCSEGQMRCNNGKCISKSLKCDGKPDCDDGSDEDRCDPVLNKCKEDEFQCLNSTMCINNLLVCNGQHDCNDGTDEGERCDVNECEVKNGGCEYKCEDLKIGFRCLCNPSYELATDKKSCKDINECEEFGKCSQICSNLNGTGYKCSCVAGYLLDRNDHRTCKAIERHPYLIFSDRYSIRKLTLHKSQFFGIVPNLAGTIAVDYHFSDGLMYWTDVKNESIQRARLHHPSKENIIKETIVSKVRTPDGIAVDWVTGKLYWTDAWAKKIEVSHMDGKDRRALIDTNLDMPRAIVLHPNTGEMFWTDWGKNPKIEKCGMDGDPSTRKAIITTEILWPNALTIDYTIDGIWWADAKLHIIEHCNLHGNNRRIVLAQDKIFHPFSISVFEDNVYWTDWYRTAIYKANKFTGNNVTLLKEGLLHSLGISMIHPQRQPASFNFCQEYNGGCSNLCLLSARHKKTHLHSCACPQGINILPDNKTCNIPDKLKCEKDRCNNGTCLPGNKLRGPKCLCNKGYSGDRCEEKDDIQIHFKDSSNANAVTIGLSVGVVALIFILFGIAAFYLYKKIQKRYISESSLRFDNPVYVKTTESIEAGGRLIPFKFWRSSPIQEPFAKDADPVDL